MNIGNIEEMAKEVEHFYPDKIHGAVGYLESKYNLDVHHAAHIATIAWGILNNRNPMALPKYYVLHAALSKN